MSSFIKFIFLRPQNMHMAKPHDTRRGLVPAIKKEVDDIYKQYGKGLEPAVIGYKPMWIYGCEVGIKRLSPSRIEVTFSSSHGEFAKVEAGW